MPNGGRSVAGSSARLVASGCIASKVSSGGILDSSVDRRPTRQERPSRDMDLYAGPFIEDAHGVEGAPEVP